jgi:hypothetical protein
VPVLPLAPGFFGSGLLDSVLVVCVVLAAAAGFLGLDWAEAEPPARARMLKAAKAQFNIRIV